MQIPQTFSLLDCMLDSSANLVQFVLKHQTNRKSGSQYNKKRQPKKRELFGVKKVCIFCDGGEKVWPISGVQKIGWRRENVSGKYKRVEERSA